jgi:hypothetical protein
MSWCREPTSDEMDLCQEVDLTKQQDQRCSSSHGGVKQHTIAQRLTSAGPEPAGTLRWKKYSMRVDASAWEPGVQVPDCTNPDIVLSTVVCSNPSFRMRPQDDPKKEHESSCEKVTKAIPRRPWSAFARSTSVQPVGQQKGQLREQQGITSGVMQKLISSTQNNSATRRPASAKPRLQRDSCSFSRVNAMPETDSAQCIGVNQRKLLILSGQLQPDSTHAKPSHQMHRRAQSHTSAEKMSRPCSGVQHGSRSVSCHRKWM